MKPRSLALALGITMLAGCASFPHLPAAIVADGEAVLRLSAKIVPGGLGVQGLVSPYMPSDVHHVTLSVFKLDGSTEVPLTDAQGNPLAATLSQAQLSQPVAFAKLGPNTTYRVKARAYADAAETQLISKGDASDQIDVAVTGDDRPTVATLPVTLIDKVFDGTATASGITFTPGTVTASGTPAITLEPLPD